MPISKEAYEALQSIIGSEWVSDDVAICEAERKGGGFATEGPPPERPACCVQPETTEEVQAIIKVCNRYMLPFAATSTYGLPQPGSDRKNVVFMDLKRMRDFDIDEENMCAIVGPGVCFAALQSEAWKRQLVTFVPLCGGNVSVLANSINAGEGATGWRWGFKGYRRVLAAEWVTGDGEILRLGSRATSKDFFWGEGPGPDLRGLMVAPLMGTPASKGVITKIGVRLFPFIKEKLVPVGDAPITTLLLPENRFKWYILNFPSRKVAIDAIYEIGKCEIGLLLMTVPPWFFSMARVRAAAPTPTGAAGFWDNWNNKTGPAAAKNQEETVLRILLYGIGSDQRLDYEEKVLLDIAGEFGASARPTRAQDETHFMSSDAIVSNIAGGRFISVIILESLDHALKAADIVNVNARKHIPPMLEDYGTTNWFVPYDLAHMGKLESLRFSTIDNQAELVAFNQDCHEEFLSLGAFPAMVDNNLYGPAWENYPEKSKEFKQIVDPNGLAFPIE